MHACNVCGWVDAYTFMLCYAMLCYAMLCYVMLLFLDVLHLGCQTVRVSFTAPGKRGNIYNPRKEM